MDTTYLVWSPYPGIVTFNPVMTPTAATLPLTPFIATPLPYFTFSPSNDKRPAVYQQPEFFTPAPMLQPAPGSKEGTTPRKRGRLGVPLSASSPSIKRVRMPVTTPIKLEDEPASVPEPESPSYAEQFALDDDELEEEEDIEVKTETKVKVEETEEVQIESDIESCEIKIESDTELEETHQDRIHGNLNLSALQELHARSTRKSRQTKTSASSPLRASPEIDDIANVYLDDSDSDQDSDFVEAAPEHPAKRTRNRAHKHTKLSSSSNWLDNLLVNGGLTSPIFANSSYLCPTCQKSYKLRKHCRRHMVVHTGLKPFSCDRCSTTFSRQDSWQRHLKRCKKSPKKPETAP